MKFLTPLLLSCVVVFLTACTTSVVKYEPVATADWQQHQLDTSQLQSWSISGRISAQTIDDGGQADYTWAQKNATDYDIQLQGPFGMGTVWFTGRADSVQLKTSSGEEMLDTNVENLMKRLNGWPFPVSGLFYWVRGLPAQSSPFQVREWNDNGLPAVMSQDGWRIEFRKYVQIEGRILPEKLFISREDEEDINVRLIIRRWELQQDIEKQANKRPNDQQQDVWE